MASKGAKVPSTGPLILKRMPMITVDCSEWGQALEVDVRTVHKPTPQSVNQLVARLKATVDRLDAEEGGTGFCKIGTDANGRNILVTFVPIEPERAKARIQKICTALANIDHTVGRGIKIDALDARLA